jgi:hypothetical protein
MTWGNNGAGPLGVPPIGPPASVNSPMIGQQGNAYPAFYLASFESVLAAVSRGEVSLNQIVNNGSQFGGLNNGPAGSNISAGNPTLLQAISQGNGQNGTNGLNGVGAGGGTVNSSFASNNTAPGTFDGGTDSTATIDPKQVMNNAGVQLVSPIQYGGN